MSMVYMLAGIGAFALVFGALFFCWYFGACWFETDTVIVTDGPREVVITDLHYDNGPADIVVEEHIVVEEEVY